MAALESLAAIVRASMAVGASAPPLAFPGEPTGPYPVP
jgi:hypothetical protein